MLAIVECDMLFQPGIASPERGKRLVGIKIPTYKYYTAGFLFARFKLNITINDASAIPAIIPENNVNGSFHHANFI